MSDFGKDNKSEEVCKTNTSNQKLTNKNADLNSNENSSFLTLPKNKINENKQKINFKLVSKTNLKGLKYKQTKYNKFQIELNFIKNIIYKQNKQKTKNSQPKQNLLSKLTNQSNSTQSKQNLSKSPPASISTLHNKNTQNLKYVNNQQKTTQITNTSTEAKKLPLKTTLYLTITIILFLATLTGCLFGIFYNKNTQAIVQDNIVQLDRIGNGEDLFLNASSLNPTVAKGLADGNGRILTMNGIDWQVVYRSGDFVTLWLADIFKSSSEYLKSYYRSNASKYVTNYETLEATYSIRTVLTNTVFPTLFNTYEELANQIIATPHDLVASNVVWQATQLEILWGESQTSTTNSKLGGGEAGSSAFDKLWLPSAPELFGGNGIDGMAAPTGIWGLTPIEMKYTSSGLTPNCWLRSGYESVLSNTACTLSPYLTQGSSSVTSEHFIRPALHLNMRSVLEKSAYKINFVGSNASHFATLNYNLEPNSLELRAELKPLGNGNNSITSITDDLGNSITLNGSGSNVNYDYVSSLNVETGEVIIIFTNVKKSLDFTVNTVSTLNITNNSPDNITNIGAYRLSTSTSNAFISAQFLNNKKPLITISNVEIKVNNAYGKGKIGSINYEYNLYQNTLVLSLSNFPTSIFSIALNIVNNDNYALSFVVDNASVLEEYDNAGNAQVVVRPNTGFWVNSFTIDGQTYYIEYFNKSIFTITNLFTLTYQARENTNEFRMHLQGINGNITITINTSTVPLSNLKEGGGAEITGVAVNTTAGGDAKVIANTLNDENSSQSTITLVAWVNAGYSFAGWSIDGGATYLVDTSGNRYGASATIPADEVRGKVVTACFTQNTNGNINTELSNGMPFLNNL